MHKYLISLLFLTVSTSVSSASFNHKSAIYQTTMTGPMMKVVTDAYVYYDGNESTAVSSEWVTQESPMGNTRRLNITRNGFVYSVDLDKKHCTKTNIKSLTDSISDPEAFAKNLKEQMGFKEGGSCEGAGLTGTKFTSSFAEMCMYKDVFMLWQTSMGTKTQVTKVKFDTALPKEKVSLPDGIKCTEGPDISQGWPGMPASGSSYTSRGDSAIDSTKEAGSSSREKPATQEDIDAAMKKAQEALKQFGDMFK